MALEIDPSSIEARQRRVRQALNILIGKAPPWTNEEESAILSEYREICDHGYGRIEVIVVDHRMEVVNVTKLKKRRDLVISKQTT